MVLKLEVEITLAARFKIECVLANDGKRFRLARVMNGFLAHGNDII